MTPPLFKLTKPTACCVAVLGFLLLGCRSNAAAGNADPSNPSDPSAEPAQASHASASSGGAHRVPISDPQRGMTAATLELPAGWKFAGQIVSAPGCHGMQDNLAFTAQAQDGVTAIIRLPGVRWAVTPANTPVAAMQILIVKGRGLQPPRERVGLSPPIPYPPKAHSRLCPATPHKSVMLSCI
jgi:hypothetical protein